MDESELVTGRCAACGAGTVCEKHFSRCLEVLRSASLTAADRKAAVRRATEVFLLGLRAVSQDAARVDSRQESSLESELQCVLARIKKVADFPGLVRIEHAKSWLLSHGTRGAVAARQLGKMSSARNTDCHRLASQLLVEIDALGGRMSTADDEDTCSSRGLGQDKSSVDNDSGMEKEKTKLFDLFDMSETKIAFGVQTSAAVTSDAGVQTGSLVDGRDKGPRATGLPSSKHQWADLVDSGSEEEDCALASSAKSLWKSASCVENCNEVCTVQAEGEVKATKKELSLFKSMAKAFVPEPRASCGILQWRPKPRLDLNELELPTPVADGVNDADFRKELLQELKHVEVFAEGVDDLRKTSEKVSEPRCNLGAWSRPLVIPESGLADADFLRLASGLGSSQRQLIPISAVECADDAYEALSRLCEAGLANYVRGEKDPPYEAELRRLAGHFDDGGKKRR